MGGEPHRPAALAGQGLSVPPHPSGPHHLSPVPQVFCLLWLPRPRHWAAGFHGHRGGERPHPWGAGPPADPSSLAQAASMAASPSPFLLRRMPAGQCYHVHTAGPPRPVSILLRGPQGSVTLLQTKLSLVPNPGGACASQSLLCAPNKFLQPSESHVGSPFTRPRCRKTKPCARRCCVLPHPQGWCQLIFLLFSS